MAEEQSIESKEQQANELYKKAVDSGDAELMSKADTLKSDLSIQKEKLRIAKNRNNGQSAEQYIPYQEQAPQYERPVEPTGEAMEWAKENPWYGDQTINKNAEATQYAYFTHFILSMKDSRLIQTIITMNWTQEFLKYTLNWVLQKKPIIKMADPLCKESHLLPMEVGKKHKAKGMA